MNGTNTGWDKYAMKVDSKREHTDGEHLLVPAVQALAIIFEGSLAEQHAAQNAQRTAAHLHPTKPKALTENESINEYRGHFQLSRVSNQL